MIKCVLFDMDGTIIDDEKWTIISKISEGKKLGYDIKEEDVIASLGLSKVNSAKHFKSIYGEDFPYKELGEYRTKYIEEDMKVNGIKLKPYVNEILEYLSNKHILKGICTSSSKKQIEIYSKYGDIFSKFDFICTGDEVKLGKPFPDIFLLGNKKANVKIEETLVIEDANSGVEAALNASMKVIMIPDLASPKGRSLESGVLILPSLKEVIDYLENYKE